MTKTPVFLLLALMWGPSLAACGQDATKPPQTAFSAHERMILEMERAGGGGAGGGM